MFSTFVHRILWLTNWPSNFVENPRESDADNDSPNLYWWIIAILAHREFCHFIGGVLEIVAGYTSDRTLPVLCQSNYYGYTTSSVRIALAVLPFRRCYSAILDNAVACNFWFCCVQRGRLCFIDLEPGTVLLLQKAPSGILPATMDKQSLGHGSTARIW